jgi:hypothetical protein
MKLRQWSTGLAIVTILMIIQGQNVPLAGASEGAAALVSLNHYKQHMQDNRNEIAHHQEKLTYTAKLLDACQPHVESGNFKLAEGLSCDSYPPAEIYACRKYHAKITLCKIKRVIHDDRTRFLEALKLATSGQNIFLKVLEEPNKFVSTMKLQLDKNFRWGVAR